MYHTIIPWHMALAQQTEVSNSVFFWKSR